MKQPALRSRRAQGFRSRSPPPTCARLGRARAGRAFRDAREAVAGDPAHGRGIGVDRQRVAIFPDAGVGNQRHRQRPHAQRLQHGEQALVALGRQALVEEHLRGRQDHAAIDVVLRSGRRRRCRCARPVTAIARDMRGDPLLQRHFGEDGVDRLQVGAALHRDDIGDVMDEALHRRGGADAVEREHGEIGVANPAEAIIPVALLVGRLGHGGGERRDDRAGFLEGAHLQGDGGADHLVLPFVGHVELARPGLPVFVGLVVEFAPDAEGSNPPAVRRRAGSA